MTYYITEVHMDPSNADGHEHISEVKWQNTSGYAAGVLSVADMVRTINAGHDVRVADGQGWVPVGVVQADPPHIRTYADDRPTDNLLSLPRY
jgi:hypothetical protein